MIWRYSCVACDGCLTPHEIRDTDREARKSARLAGWTREAGKDYCPDYPACKSKAVSS